MGQLLLKLYLLPKMALWLGSSAFQMPYQIEPILIPIEEVMLTERTLPDIFINDQGNGVTLPSLNGLPFSW